MKRVMAAAAVLVAVLAVLAMGIFWSAESHKIVGNVVAEVESTDGKRLCIDDDGGDNISTSSFTKSSTKRMKIIDGNVSLVKEIEDRCSRFKSYRLIEYYCSDDGKARILSTPIDCEGECVDGACYMDSLEQLHATYEEDQGQIQDPQEPISQDSVQTTQQVISSPMVELINETSYSYRISNNLVEYTIEHPKAQSSKTNNLALRIIGQDGWSFDALLSIGDNKLENSDQNFRLWIGDPTDIKIYEGEDKATIEFSYAAPKLSGSYVGNGSGFLESGANITLYKNDTRIYIDAYYNIKRSFKNHNGFKNGVVEGFENGIFVGTTSGMILDKGYKPFMGLEYMPDKSINGNYVPVWYEVKEIRLKWWQKITNRCGMKVQVGKKIRAVPNKFNDYYVIKKNDKGVLFYIPDYQKIIMDGPFKDKYIEGCGASIPRNQLMRVGIDLDQVLSSSGPGTEWIRLEIPAGVYESKTVIVPDLPFGEEYKDVYENEVELLKGAN